MTPKVSEKINSLTSHFETTKSDLLRKAINLLEIAIKAQEEGKEIGIAKDGELATSIIIL